MSADPNYTSIGIFISLAGNTVISLSLNLQKLAHKRVNEAALAASNGSGSTTQTPSLSRRASSNSTLNQDHHELAEQRPLLPYSASSNAYGTSKPRTWWVSLRRQSPRQVPQSPQAANGDLEQEHEDDDDEIDEVPRGETDYLYSKLWWLGFLLMNVGELGNFLSYAYAPASLVAPLGAVALVANCFFAPLILGERFRKRDLIGIFLAIIGTVTIVLSSKPTDVRLDKDGLIRAISQPIFIGYTIFTICAIFFLTILSQGNAGREWIFIDVGICALYGGYTVLATKGLSTLLSLRLIEVYKIWLTYPLIVVLLGTGIGQIRYLNRALMKFDSKHVIPTNFTLFTLSALCGSAILYRDFENVSLHRMISFLYGIITVFAAIFLLTYTAPVSSGTPLVTLDDPISVITSPISPSTDGTQGHHAAAMSINGNKYILRTKSSTANLGISPGQYLLIAASPPNNEGAQRIARDVERDFGSTRARRGRSYAQDNDRSRSRSRDGRRRTIHFEDAPSNGR